MIILYYLNLIKINMNILFSNLHNAHCRSNNCCRLCAVRSTVMRLFRIRQYGVSIKVHKVHKYLSVHRIVLG